MNSARRTKPAPRRGAAAFAADTPVATGDAASRRHALACAVASLLALPGAGALAQDAAASPSLTVVPTLGTTTSYTHTSRSAGFDDGGQFIAQVSPGLSIRSRAGSIIGSLEYRLNANYYSQTTGARHLEHSLNASAVAEAVPKWLYVDGQASVTQQYLNPYGLQTAQGSLLYNANRIDVLNVRLSPYMRGPIGEFAEGEFRLFGGATNGYKSVTSDSTTSGGSLSLQSRRRNAMLGWSLGAQQQRVDYRAGRATDTQRVSAGLSLAPVPELVMLARGGFEETDVGGYESKRYDNYGAGVHWLPSERTTVSLDADHRYFGTAHQVTLEQKLRRFVFRFTSSRDTSTDTGTSQAVTLYQLWYSALASVVPDPVQRDLRVREILQLQNADPNTVVSGGTLTSAVSLNRRADLSLAYVGQRTSVTLLGFDSDTRIIDNPANIPNDGPIKMRGAIVTVSHRLTPRATVTLTGSSQHTAANLRQGPVELNSVSLGLASVVSSNATANVSARYSLSDGDPMSTYRESALSASLNLRF